MTSFASYVEGPCDGPAIVLLHSLASSAALWAPQFPIWSKLFKVIRIDLPGHGASAPADRMLDMHALSSGVVAALDLHAVDQAAIVGISWGGMIAQAVALHYPERVSALVIAHAGARTNAALSEMWEQRLLAFEAEGFVTQAPATLARWFTPDFIAQAPLTVAWVGSLIRSTSARGYTDAIRAIQGLDHLGRLNEIACPTLVIAGEHDLAVPADAARAIAQAIPGARYKLLKGAAHIGNVEQATRFTELVGDFLKQSLLSNGAANAEVPCSNPHDLEVFLGETRHV